MSRSGYVDDDCDGTLGLYRHAVHRAITGKRGQQFLRLTLDALDALPVKELEAESLVVGGGYCTLGAVGAAHGMNIERIDPEDPTQVADAFGIAECMAREIVFENDEQGDSWVEIQWVKRNYYDYIPTIRKHETPAERWTRMRAWIAEQIIEPKP